MSVEIIRAIITAVDNFSRPMQRIALSVAGPAQAFARVGQAAGGVATQVGSLLGPLAAIGGAISLAGIGRAVMDFTNLGSEVNDTAIKLGISAQALQQFRYAGNLAGVSNETLEGGIKKLNKTMFDVTKGAAPEAREVFRQLGISILDSSGRMRSAGDVMPELIKGFDRIGNSGVRAGAAMALFGKSGQDMVPLLTQGSAEFEKLRNEAMRFGLVLSDDAVAAGDAFGDTIEKLTKAVKGFFLELGAKLAPVLQPLVEKLTEWLVLNRELITSRLAAFVDGFAQAMEKIDWDAFFAGLSGAMAALGQFTAWLGPTGTLLSALGLMFAPLVASVGYLAITLGGASLALVKWAAAMTIAPVITAFVAAIRAGTGVVFAFNWAVSANPIGLMVLAVTALIGAGWALYQNWDKVVGFLTASWAMIRKGIAEVIQFIIGAYGKAAELVPDWAGGRELRGKFETMRRDVRDWGEGGAAAQAADASQAGGADLLGANPGARVNGEIVVRLENAPPGSRVERIDNGGSGLDLGVDVGQRPMFMGA
jgi:hypothetical protein